MLCRHTPYGICNKAIIKVPSHIKHAIIPYKICVQNSQFQNSAAVVVMRSTHTLKRICTKPRRWTTDLLLKMQSAVIQITFLPRSSFEEMPDKDLTEAICFARLRCTTVADCDIRFTA